MLPLTTSPNCVFNCSTCLGRVQNKHIGDFQICYSHTCYATYSKQLHVTYDETREHKSHVTYEETREHKSHITDEETCDHNGHVTYEKT